MATRKNAVATHADSSPSDFAFESVSFNAPITMNAKPSKLLEAFKICGWRSIASNLRYGRYALLVAAREYSRSAQCAAPPDRPYTKVAMAVHGDKLPSSS